MTRSRFTQQQFDDALAAMIREHSESGAVRCRIVARDLHRSVVGGSQPNRMPMACNAMWKLAENLEHIVVRRTPSGRSSSLEIEYRLDPGTTVRLPSASAQRSTYEVLLTSASDRSPSPARNVPAGTPSADTRLPDADLYLVACVKLKRDTPMPARDLYASPWFRKARACIEKTGRPWAILSARHGLVWPDEIVAPYEETLGKEPAAQRRWAERVLTSLAPHLAGVRTIAMLAGNAYRQLLVPELRERGIDVLVPMKELAQGKQLQWLDLCLSRMPNDQASFPGPPRPARARVEHMRRFYECLARLEWHLDGARKLSDCSGRLSWPERGVYFFMEPGETRSDSGPGLRIVRVGTHGLRPGSKSTLWNRLAQHKGTRSGGGNHRTSIFRLIVGTALMARDRLDCPSWGDRQSMANRETRAMERAVETAVSAKIGRMPFLWLPVDDEPGPESLRGYIERNSIALLSNYRAQPLDAPSGTWLGHHCDREKVRASGLWNSEHVDEAYDSAFLDAMARLVDRVGNPG